MKVQDYSQMIGYLTRDKTTDVPGSMAHELRMASAETDAVKDMINKQYGPGTMKYGSEIPQPATRDDVIQIDAINSFMKRNPAAEGGRIGFDKGGMVKLVEYVESLPKGTTVTLKMVQDYVKKNKLKVNIPNFFNRKAPNIKGKKFISDTRSKDLKLTDTEKANIEKYGKAKYNKLNTQDKYAVRQGREVGKLAPEKTQKVKFKKEYNKAIKYYKKKGVEPNIDSLRKNIARNDGKFTPGNIKLQGEAGLSGLFKKYEKTDLIADLKKGKTPFEVAIEYFDKNEKEVLKTLEGKTA